MPRGEFRIGYKLLSLVILAFAVIASIIFAVASPTAHAATGINERINFQGRLFNAQGAVVPDGYYNIEFKIYQDGDGLTAGNTTGSPAGSLKWTESWLNDDSNGVLVRNGYMSVELGSVTPFGSSVDWNQSVLWLSMNIGSTNATCTPFGSCSPDGEMVPMKRMSATPYALNAGKLGGLTASGFIQNTTTLQTANIAVQSAGSGSIAALVQGASGQSVDILQVKATGTASPLFSVSSGGTVTIQPVADGAGIFAVKNAAGSTIALSVNTSTGLVSVTGNVQAAGLVSASLDTASATTLTVGTATASAITIGKASTTTTIQGNTAVTLNTTTGTTITCQNVSGYLSTCDASVLTPSAANFVQNGTSLQPTSNFYISGTGRTDTKFLTPTIDTATAAILNIGTTGTPTTTGISLNQNTTVVAGKSLIITGSGTRPGSPLEGTIYYDTTTKQLLVYSNGKWQSDRSTSTKIVAASNSSQALKDGADYVADGTADDIEINAALTAATGGKVYLAEGTYTIAASISVPNNTTLSGAGSGTVITIPNGVNATFTAVTNTTTGGNGTGVVIQDLKLDGNKAGQGAGNYGMYGITFNGMGSGTLPGGKISNVSVVNWYGNGAFLWTYAGIYIAAGQRNTISNVVVHGNTNNGINITGTYNTVTGSDFTGNNYGIHLVANNNTVTGNSASANTAIGIYLETASQNTVSGNVATANTNQNIYLLNSSSNTVSGNQALGSSSSDGIGIASTSTYNIVSSNIVQANSAGGIYLGSPATNNTITGNKIHNNGGNNNRGIYFVGASSNTITDNTITDTANSASNNPINIDVNSNNNYLSNNVFSSTATGGSIVDAGTGTKYSNQSRTEGGGQITTRIANDAVAFTVQNASGTNALVVDTANDKVLVAGTLDTTTATTLNIGTTNATAINLATNAAAHTVAIATGAAPQTVTVGSLDTTSAMTIQGGTNGIALNTGNSSGIISFGVGNVNKLGISSSTISANNTVYSFNDINGDSILSMDAGTNNVTVAWNRNLEVAGGANFLKGLSIQGASITTVYTTPGGASLGTAINITNHDQAAYATLLALGVTSGSHSTARGILVADARTVAHQATIGVLSPDENQIFGFSWDGSNTTARLSNTANAIALQGGGVDLITSTKSGTDALVTVGVAGTNAGKLVLATAANANILTLQSATQTGSYTLTIPAVTANATICTDNTICAGYAPASGSASYIQNQNSTAQVTSNFWISGTGQAATFTATAVNTSTIDTPSSGVLTIGGTNTTSVSVTKDTTIAADKSLIITGSGTRPVSPAEGTLYYDTTTKQMIQWNGTKWVNNGSDAYLVAASNSSQADKDAADYVVDGTADQTEINSALDRADPASAISGARKSGKVYLFAGTYTTNDVISIPNNTTLAGSGRGSLIQFANINGQTKNMITNSDITTGTGVTVRDLQLDGSDSVNTSGTMHGMYLNGMGGGSGASARQGANIINNWVNNFFNNGIHLNGSPNSTIIGNNVQGNSGSGIYISSSNRSNITNNISQGNGGSGIVLAGAVSENVVANTLAVNGTAGVYINGGSNNNTIFGNNFYNNGGNTANNAIHFPASANGDFNTITNNTINDTSGTTTNYAINFLDTTSNSNYLADNVFTSTAGTSTINDAPANNTVYANQPRGEAGAKLTNRTANDTEAFTIQNAGGTNVLTVDTTNNKVLVAGALDTTTATTLTVGTTTATAITIGSGAITTTIQGNTGVTLNGTTGTTMVCRNASGLLSSCDAAYLTPTATNFIQNQNASAQTTANFWISGTGQAATLTAGTVNATTSLVTSTIDTASGVALNIGGTTASSVDVGKSAGTINLKANSTLVGTSGGTITVQGATQATSNTTGNLFVLKGSTGNGSGAGGQLTLQGGNAGTTSGANGGNVYISGGAGTGTGVGGLVVMTTPTFSTAVTDANCFTGGAPVAASCTITSASVDGSSAVLAGFTVDGQTATLPNPTITTAGRVVYVTASSATSDFTLSVNGGGQGNLIAMRKNTTATMIWNGSAWTAAGASSSTTLQAAYDNTLQSAGGAELVVSKTTATNGFTIRDSTTNSVNGALLTVQSSSAANLFSVNSNVTEYATDAGAEVYGASTSTFPASTWSAISGSISRYTTTGDNISTGQASVAVTTTALGSSGVKNALSTTLTPNMSYNVSFTTRLDSASTTLTTMTVYYSIDGSALSTQCAVSQTAKTSIWSKVNCTFTAPSSGITASNAILILQGSGVVRTFYVDNLSVTIAADYNYATDGSVGDAANFATNWSYSTGIGTGTVTHNTGDGNDASNSATVAISAGAANAGVRNKLSINPLTSTLYRVSVYAKLSSGTFTDFAVRYSPNGGTNYVDCVDYKTRTVTTTAWTQITCYIKTSATTVTSPYVYFVEGSSAVRTFSVDTFSMTLTTNTAPNVQIGSGSNGGPTTLLTLDKGASAPIASDNDALLGSMYYDTTLGKLQCYEADGWGACGSSPDTVVTISPEYNNAVMHGTGIGTMTSDLCSDTLNINDGSSGQSTICGTNETYNFYKWTSPQASAQTYGIYVTYQLPSTFKEFASGQTSLMGRTDSTSSTVSYQIYRSDSDTGLTACGSSVAVSTGVQTAWQRVSANGAADPSTCGFEPNDSIVVKINMTASGTSNSYVGNLNFIFSNR